jgi:hypothetical protein
MRDPRDPRACSRRAALAGLGAAGLGVAELPWAAGLGLAMATGLPRAALAGPELCGQGPPPPYPPHDRPPLVHSWLAGGRQDGPPPDCTGLGRRDPELLIRLVGSYVAPGDMTAQLLRLGAVSTLKGMSYWSFTDRKRLTLIQEAYAVDSLATQRPRADFTLDELRRGDELYFLQRDNRSSALVPYGLRVLPTGPESLLLRIENLGDIKMMGLTLVAAREVQWAVTIERLGGTRYGYRSLLAVQRLRLGPADKHRLSNLARAVAMFDLLAGQQTEVESLR